MFLRTLKKILLLFIITCLSVPIHVSAGAWGARGPRSPSTGTAGLCEPFDKGSGKCTQLFCCKHSQVLKHLSSPVFICFICYMINTCLELTLYLLFSLLIIFSSSDNLRFIFFPDWITFFRFYFRICWGTAADSRSFPSSALWCTPVFWLLGALSCLIVPPLWAVCVFLHVLFWWCVLQFPHYI